MAFKVCVCVLFECVHECALPRLIQKVSDLFMCCGAIINFSAAVGEHGAELHVAVCVRAQCVVVCPTTVSQTPEENSRLSSDLSLLPSSSPCLLFFSSSSLF